MKKEKQDKPAKTEKKQARKNIQQQLITELKAITGQLGQKAEDVVIDIEKESKKLAKKITKGFKAILPDHKEEPKAKPIESKPARSKPETKSTTVKAADKPAPVEIKKSATIKKPKAEAAPEKVVPEKAAPAKTAATKTSKAKTTA
jgi:hypothetical protein